ncbi:MAG: hypothetical protein HYZ29_26170 [Myxococcales bacterium]|nr:hypothetical protein [Myxococcales bacterium]
MPILVFAQAADQVVDLAGLVRSATRHFRLELEVLSASGGAARVRLSGASFTLRARAATATDLERARRAELAGRAAGMSDLAARCATVWEVEPEPGASERALHQLCAIAAATALGPVLPPDDSTLYGVRGAMQRADALGSES